MGHEDVPVVVVYGGELANSVDVQVEGSVRSHYFKLHHLIERANILGEELNVKFLRLLRL